MHQTDRTSSHGKCALWTIRNFCPRCPRRWAKLTAETNLPRDASGVLLSWCSSRATCHMISLRTTAAFLQKTSCCLHGHLVSDRSALAARYDSSPITSCVNHMLTVSGSPRDTNSVSVSDLDTLTKHRKQNHEI